MPPSTNRLRQRPLVAVLTILLVALCLRIFVLVLPVLEPTVPSSATKGVSTKYRLPINPHSTLGQDLLSIEHVPQESSFVVTFRATKKGALRCPNPHLMGRLSGPALVMLEFQTQQTGTQQQTQTQLKGRYQVPLAGVYYVDIIVVMCDNFSHDIHCNFSKTCVEDPNHHRLLHETAAVPIRQNHWHHPATRSLSGYWLHQHHSQQNYPYSPVHTRFQPGGCLLPTSKKSQNKQANPSSQPLPKHCIAPTQRTQLESYTQYQYYYNEDYIKAERSTYRGPDNTTTNQLLRLTNPFPKNASSLWANRPTTICLVGDSHSRNLHTSMKDHHGISLPTNNIRVEYPLTSKHPRNIHNTSLLALTQQSTNNSSSSSSASPSCDAVILAVGQWPASFQSHSKPKPTLFAEYQEQIRTMLTKLHLHLAKDITNSTTTTKEDPQRPVQVILRSIHYNPLNVMNSATCPPLDWRNPTVMDGYNAILRRAVEDHNRQVHHQQQQQQPQLVVFPKIRFVDTNFIVGALWDASHDWGHVPPAPTHVESLYLVGAAIGLIET